MDLSSFVLFPALCGAEFYAEQRNPGRPFPGKSFLQSLRYGGSGGDGRQAAHVSGILCPDFYISGIGAGQEASDYLYWKKYDGTLLFPLSAADCYEWTDDSENTSASERVGIVWRLPDHRSGAGKPACQLAV